MSPSDVGRCIPIVPLPSLEPSSGPLGIFRAFGIQVSVLHLNMANASVVNAKPWGAVLAGFCVSIYESVDVLNVFWL